MNFSTLSAILKGEWLINQQWAQAHLHIVHSIMKGEGRIDLLQNPKNSPNETISTVPAATAAGNLYDVRPNTDISMLPAGSIAMITLSGPMLKNGDMCTYGMVDQTISINNLASAKNVSAIILNIDSPGGQADGTAMLANAIKEAGKTKPVIAIVNDGMAASAAMWIASAANEIYATQPTDQFGSIGVYTTIADWKAYYESQGLITKDIYAPQSTDKNLSYYEALAGNEAPLKDELSVLADAFINTVITNRFGKLKNDSWQTGKLFFAADAKKIGLIDGIKSLNEVVKRIQTLSKPIQKTNSNIMAFEKTLITAKADAFALTDDGFVLSEEQLNNLEASIEASDAATKAATDTATKLAITENLVLSLQKNVADLQKERDSAQETIGIKITRIAALQEEVAALGKAPSGSGSTLITKEDDHRQGSEKVPSWMDDNNPSNQFADKRLRSKK